jgi:uncharacterized protein (DUF362 family)
MDIRNDLQSSGRRNFIAKAGAGAIGIAGAQMMPHAAHGALFGRRTGRVSFVTGTDAREAAYNSLKPLQREIEHAIGDRQVVIKLNFGVVDPAMWLAATDPNQVCGIMDFLGEFYDRKVILSEGTSVTDTSSHLGYENFGYTPLMREYDTEFIDHNDLDTQVRFVKDNRGHPFPINIVDLYLHPDKYYYISATRFKPSGGVVITLSLKNIVMGSPINHYKWKKAQGRNEKSFVHQGGNRGQSWNIFMMAASGIQPHLAVLDGVVTMEGDGPLDGTPVEHGVAVASTDWLAADRLATELMGVDYSMVKYLEWCGKMGYGTDDLDAMNIIGPDWRQHIIQYKMNKNYEKQTAWVHEDAQIEQEKRLGTGL